MYICDFSRSDGAGSATSRKTRGLTRSVRARMVPPLPARVAAFKDDDHAQTFVLHPILEFAQLGLELAQLLLILFGLQFLAVGGVGFFAHKMVAFRSEVGGGVG